MWAICKRDLRSYFNGMAGPTLTAFMLAGGALYFYAYNLSLGYADFGYYTLYRTLFFFLFYVPVLTMRSFAAERRNHTDQLLLTAPVTTAQIVLGKYLAMCAMFALPCLGYAAMILTLLALGASGAATLGSFACLGCYLLLGAAAIALGMCCSSLTEHTLVAGILALAVLLLAYLMPSLRTMFITGSTGALLAFFVLAALVALLVGWRSKSFLAGSLTFTGSVAVITALFFARFSASRLPDAFSTVLGALCLFSPFEDFVGQIFSVPAVVYYLSVIALALLFTTQQLEQRRWH